jgi:hypothetical protein
VPRFFAGTFLLLAAACTKDINSKDAIRQAVIDHLAARKGLDLNLSSLNIVVTSLNIREKDAEATISFEPRGGGRGMDMKYRFERQSGKWVVMGKQDSGAAHSAGPDAGSAVLPPGHPPATSPGSALPPDHPPLGGGKK